ncbi:MAG: AbrB/MazE/SpoVT family DNA-binding domain-containing protein [Myxococcota bacterium]
MLSSRITSKGQTTIPADIRRSLGLSAHDRLGYELDGDRLIVYPLRGTILDHRGTVKPRNRPEDFRAIREQVMEEVACDIAKKLS